MKKYCNLIFVLLLLNSCTTKDYLQFEDMSFSTVTYVKNTLDYPVLVQCYFRPFNDNNFWCVNELVKYSEPIEILPNEYKVVMDYVAPYGIKIFRGSDSTLLFENFNKWFASSNGTLSYSPEDEKKLGTIVGKKIIPKKWQKVAMYSVKDSYFLQNERYLCENVPWSLYPIMIEFRDCYENLIEEYDEQRKIIYKDITDGYALVNCIVLNKTAACFNP